MKSFTCFASASIVALCGVMALGCSGEKPAPARVESKPSQSKPVESKSDPPVSGAVVEQPLIAPAAPPAAPVSSDAATSPLEGGATPDAASAPVGDAPPSKLRKTGESLWRVFGGALGGQGDSEDGAGDEKKEADEDGSDDAP